MKRIVPLVLIVAVIGLVITPLWAAEGDAPAPVENRAPGSKIAGAITSVTGMAISPLLATSVYGAYQWVAAKKNGTPAEDLPWYARWSFFLPALILVGAAAAKDAFGTVLPPGLKKPVDILETLENKVSGLVVAGAVVPLSMSTLSDMLLGQAQSADAPVTGLAMIHIGAIDFSWLLNILTVPFGIAVFVVVWMASHAINVLILLSPWGAIDAALKSARTALLGVLTITANFNPWLSAGLSLVVILIAWLVAGWAFRLTIFGSIFTWDFFTGRRNRYKVAPSGNKVFSGGNLPKVPVRTYGRLQKTEGGLRFTFRPWLVLKEQSVEVPAADLAVGKGLFFSTMLNGESETWFLLPPRYRGHEEEFSTAYGLGAVRPAGLRKAWSAMRELFGGGAARTQVV